MELILWRHADAEDGGPDLERRLTARGRKDAAAMAKWLAARLPAATTVLSSAASDIDMRSPATMKPRPRVASG